MGGKACIRGMRVTAAMIVSQIGAGHSMEDILKDYLASINLSYNAIVNECYKLINESIIYCFTRFYLT
jgi:uncharacterized protein (DUF433 family)